MYILAIFGSGTWTGWMNKVNSIDKFDEEGVGSDSRSILESACLFFP